MINHQAWAERVLSHLESQPASAANLASARAIAAREGGPPCCPDSWELLTWLRGREAIEAHENLVSPEEYADMLAAEWDLYGTDGP